MRIGHRRPRASKGRRKKYGVSNRRCFKFNIVNSQVTFQRDFAQFALVRELPVIVGVGEFVLLFNLSVDTGGHP